jgi:peroxiredoxin family protein
MGEQKKLSIIAFSGNFDKAIAVFTLATGAAAVGYNVSIFFTFWGLNIIKTKKGRTPLGKGVLDRVFNVLMGGLKNLPLTRLNFLGISPLLMTYMMRKNKVATLYELIDAAKALNINFYACEMAMIILGIKQTDLIPQVKKGCSIEVLGVAKFLEKSEGGQVLFI